MRKGRKLNKMENTIKLLSISRYPYRSEFSFPKEQQFFGILRKFLIKLGFKKDDISILGYGRPIDEGGETIQEVEDNIKKYVNKIHNFYNGIYSIDIIYFDKEVYLIINYKENKQKTISKALDEFIDWERTK